MDQTSTPRETRVTKRSLYHWVFYRTAGWQVLLVAVIIVTVFARVFPLEMQKRIVNQAIGMGDVEKLVLYCGLYLAAVLLATSLKFAINSLQTYIGQKTLLHIRERLFAHILSLPLPFFRRTSSGFVISALVSELAAVSEFIGAAIAVPLVNVLTLVAFASYMFYLDWRLALLSLAIYPFEIIIIPQLQKRANKANRERIDAARTASTLVGEAISGVHEVHGNASQALERVKLRASFKDLFTLNVRMQIYRYAIKFVNNLIQNLGPFVLFLVGGYLAIQGEFALGSLVAFLSAYEKVYEPWKELMDFYQLYQDSVVRYGRIMEYFDEDPAHPLVSPEALSAVSKEGEKNKENTPGEHARLAFKELSGAVGVKETSYVIEGNIRLIDRVSMELKPGEQAALVGFSGSGKSTLALLVAQLYDYTLGSITIGGEEIKDLPKADVAANVGMVAQHPFIFAGTVKENLHYGRRALLEAALPMPDTEADDDAWRAREATIQAELPSLDRTIEVVQQVGLFVDVLRFGARKVIPEGDSPELTERLTAMRLRFQEEYGQELAEDVEFFDTEAYLAYCSVAENILFGSPAHPDYALEGLHASKPFLTFLRKHELVEKLELLGAHVARETVDILGISPDNPDLFENSPIPQLAFPDYQGLVARLDKNGLSSLQAGDRSLLLKLALAFTPGQHKMADLPVSFRDEILAARRDFRDFIRNGDDETGEGPVRFFRMEQYNHALSILENIIFGRIKAASGGAFDRVNQSVIQLTIEEGILEEIVAIGLEFDVGSQGDRLSGGQRQKLALARAFLKEPPVLILDEATAALDNASQARIQNLLETKWKGRSTLLAVAHRLDTIKNFDTIYVLKAGKVVERGSYAELLERKGALYELVHGAR